MEFCIIYQRPLIFFYFFEDAVDCSDRLFLPSLGPLKIKSSEQKTATSTPPQTFQRLPPPKYDWFQTKTLINIAIYTKWKDIKKYHVVIINSVEVCHFFFYNYTTNRITIIF